MGSRNSDTKTANAVIAQEVHSLALQPGETIRMTCPHCNARDERSLAVTRVALGIVYRCHRATCNTSSFIPTAGEILPAPDKESSRERSFRPFTGERFPLSDASLQFFAEHYELARATARLFIEETKTEYALPIFDSLGHIRGYNIRQPWKLAPMPGRQDCPKSLIYMESSGPVQSWYYHHGQLPFVLVEDQLSAIKLYASGIANAVALLGTYIDAERVREIAMLHPKEVIIALDSDATSRAFLAAKKWGLAFRKIRVAMLSKDLKDIPMNDFNEVLGIHE